MSLLSSAVRAAGAIALVAAASAEAAPVAAGTNASGTVSVLESLSLLRKSDLDFGILVPTTAGTAVVNPVSGAVTTTGGVTAVGSSGHRAVFTATGSRNSVVLIRIPQKPIMLTRVGGTETMTVSSWTLDGDKNRKIALGKAFDFGVGATVTVNAGQAEGTYIGTFDVTVQYP